MEVIFFNMVILMALMSLILFCLYDFVFSIHSDFTMNRLTPDHLLVIVENLELFVHILDIIIVPLNAVLVKQ